MLLAFDTATSAVTVALHDGAAVLAEHTVVDPLRHAELLAPGIEAVLSSANAAPADLTRIAVGVGPGPFTGLRVGVMTARTLGAVLGVPVVGVCTLDVVAAAVRPRPEEFRVATDARRREVYWAAYDTTGRRTTEPAVGLPADVSYAGPVEGRGAWLYPDAFPQPVGPEWPSAGDLARLVVAEAAPLLPADPLYLRRPDAAVPGVRKPVR